MEKPTAYLNIAQQTEIINKLRDVTDNTELRYKLFCEHGEKFSSITLLVSGLLFWRAGFRAFHLDRYGKSRIQTLLASTTACLPGGLMHSMVVRSTLTDYFRSENPWVYGIKSVAIHQVGLLFTWLASTGTIFFIAQKHGMIPVPHNLFKRENFKIATEFINKRLKPYRKTYAITFLGSSTIMLLIGLLEHKQSQTLLAKINRKTLIARED